MSFCFHRLHRILQKNCGQVLGHDGFVFAAEWPEHDEDAMKDDEVEVPVQINGKTKCSHQYSG